MKKILIIGYDAIYRALSKIKESLKFFREPEPEPEPDIGLTTYGENPIYHVQLVNPHSPQTFPRKAPASGNFTNENKKKASKNRLKKRRAKNKRAKAARKKQRKIQHVNFKTFYKTFSQLFEHE